MNPLYMLDAVLTDWLSPRGRRLVHALIVLVAAGVGIWQAADGDWKAVLVAVAGALYAAANKANTPVTDLAEPDEDDVEDDGQTYEEAGGHSLGDSDGSVIYFDVFDRGPASENPYGDRI